MTPEWITIQSACMSVALMAKVEYIEGARGHKVPVLDGYSYHRSKTTAGGTKLKLVCSKRKALKCMAFIFVDDEDTVLETHHEHSHQPTPGEVQTRQLKANMRKRAREEATPMPVVYDQEKVKLLQGAAPAETASTFPHFRGVKTVLYRERRKRFPAMPATRAEISLEGDWARTTQGERFLLSMDGEGDDKILIFASDLGLQELASADMYHVDGTFQTAPSIFYQIITLHASVLGVMKPLVFGLLPNKETSTYVRFLQILRTAAAEKGYHLNPSRLMQDFKKALHNATLKVFPDAQVKGCFFHFSQCLWRKLQNIGLAVSYKELPEVRTWFRMALALPMMPLPQVPSAFSLVKEKTPDAPRIQEFNEYLSKTWLTGFPLEMWNYFKHNGPRTNNHVEGFHNRLRKKAGKAHPNLYEVVELFAHEEAASAVHILQVQSGQPAPKRRKKYDNIDSRLDQLGLEYMLCDRTMESYLKAVGHLMDNNGPL